MDHKVVHGECVVARDGEAPAFMKPGGLQRSDTIGCELLVEPVPPRCPFAEPFPSLSDWCDTLDEPGRVVLAGDTEPPGLVWPALVTATLELEPGL